MANDASLEAGRQAEKSAEITPTLIVSQPKKLESLLETLVLLDRVSEVMGEDRSGDLGGAGGTTGGQQGDDDGIQQSLREKAIAHLPHTPVMQQELARHIEKEVKKLQKEVKRAAKRATKPGSAHQLTLLYARIRRLNALLSDMLHASHEIIRRLYIKIFVDKQSLT